jgi:hypothetical protein
MNDEWRLQVDPQDSGHTGLLLELLQARELEHDLSAAFGDRVIVSREDAHVFLYAGSREQAELARDHLTAPAAEHGWDLDIEMKRWHPVAEDWEDADAPMPADEDARGAERAEAMAREDAEAAATGDPEFEVRVDLPSRHDAVRFAEQLTAEGAPAVHRFRYLLVGAPDEDTAEAMAERIRGEAPPGSKVTVEGTWAAVLKEMPRNPYAVFGGLGV